MAVDNAEKTENARKLFQHWDRTAGVGGHYLRGKFGNGHELRANMKGRNKADIFIRNGKHDYHKYTATRNKNGDIKVSKGRGVSHPNYKRVIMLSEAGRGLTSLKRTGRLRGRSARFSKASAGRSGG